ncbi:hypothetical protein TH53_14295 [Pedobacter lusitanus]|uniref:Uncharacterized protein n=1 Tax=Pedobacter lusitanus TaxID=1503925 RepID=A0A0D0F4H7_9SPHI|nr:hypothetical protein TH53_14295 [Pedobacter lusitanus]
MCSAAHDDFIGRFFISNEACMSVAFGRLMQFHILFFISCILLFNGYEACCAFSFAGFISAY